MYSKQLLNQVVLIAIFNNLKSFVGSSLNCVQKVLLHTGIDLMPALRYSSCNTIAIVAVVQSVTRPELRSLLN